MYELSVVYYFTGRIIDAILSQNNNAYDANVRWRITDKIIVIYPNNDPTIVPIEQTGFFARERIFLWSQKRALSIFIVASREITLGFGMAKRRAFQYLRREKISRVLLRRACATRILPGCFALKYHGHFPRVTKYRHCHRI